MVNVRDVGVEFRDKKEEEFAKLIEKLGLTNDIEVAHFALNHCCQEFMEAGTLAIPELARKFFGDPERGEA